MSKNALADRPPIRLLERCPVCINSKWSAFLDRIATDTEVVPDYLIIEPVGRRPDYVTGVTILPIIAGSIALLHCWQHTLARYMWEAPRRFIEDGEESVTAAPRELTEETGLIARAEALHFAENVAPEAATITALGALFTADDCRPGGQTPTTEIGGGALCLFSRDEIEAMVDRYEIQDATTLALLYM